jgi:lipoprotein-anchoring transpeptidase ErfK/SrfK
MKKFLVLLTISLLLLTGCTANTMATQPAAATGTTTTVPAAQAPDRGQTNGKAVTAEPAAGPELSGTVRVTPAPHAYSILVKKSAYKLYLLDQGEPVAVWGVALGKNPGQKQQRGDMKTPTGLFRIDEIDDASAWTHDFKDGKGVIKGAYGPFFLSLDTEALSKGQWGGIGIHGTHDPASIGTRASEGCIRLRNDDLKVLKAYAFVGMQVKIEE